MVVDPVNGCGMPCSGMPTGEIDVDEFKGRMPLLLPIDGGGSGGASMMGAGRMDGEGDGDRDDEEEDDDEVDA